MSDSDLTAHLVTARDQVFQVGVDITHDRVDLAVSRLIALHILMSEWLEAETDQ